MKSNFINSSLFTLALVIFAQNASATSSVEELIAQYNVKVDRPKTCPLESKKLSDTLTKLESLKSALKDNCLTDKNEKLNDILNSFKSLETDLQKNNLIDKTLEEAVSDSVNGDTKTEGLNGVKFSTIFNNVNSLIKKKQCNLDDGRVLQSIADFVYDSTQLGLVAGNQAGAIIAGGGLIVSSSLKLIDMILKQRFDFEKIADRQSFIKINCSFYDIRNTLESEGILEVENSRSREDLKDANFYIEEINKSLKRNEEARTNQANYFTSVDSDKVKESVGNIATVKKSLLRLKEIISQAKYDGLPDETKKMLAVTDIMKEYETFVFQLNYYRSLNISSIPMLDDMFLVELNKFNPVDMNSINELIKMPIDNFNKNVKPIFLYHIVRIVTDIESKENKEIEKNAEFKKAYIAKLDQEKKELNEKLVQVTAIKTKLDKIVSEKKYSGLDDGSDNLVAIIEDYKMVSGEIYGEWGEKFLKYTSLKSSEESDRFAEKYDRFAKKHNLLAVDMISIDNDKNVYFCQDAQKLKLSFKYADSLVQEGYDFLVTNKDLIYGDVKNYYNQTLNEEDSKVLGSVEKIQRHYVSTMLAMKSINGKEIAPEDLDKYLKKTNFFTNQYLGRSILDVEAGRKKIKLIQDKFDQANCYKLMKEDIN